MGSYYIVTPNIFLLLFFMSLHPVGRAMIRGSFTDLLAVKGRKFKIFYSSVLIEIIRLSVNSICSFWQYNSIWGVPHTPKISETAGPMTMKFLPDVKLNKEARNQKKILT